MKKKKNKINKLNHKINILIILTFRISKINYKKFKIQANKILLVTKKLKKLKKTQN
jgi:hypothetical protein